MNTGKDVWIRDHEGDLVNIKGFQTIQIHESLDSKEPVLVVAEDERNQVQLCSGTLSECRTYLASLSLKLVNDR